MLFAEAVTFTSSEFDTGAIIGLLLLLALLFAAAVFTLLGGVIAGYRVGADPTRRVARAVWISSLTLTTLAGVPAISSGDPEFMATIAVAAGVMVAMRQLGAAVASSRLDDRSGAEQHADLGDEA